MSAALLAAASPGQITTPSVAYGALSPIFIVLGAALLGVVAEAVVPRQDRFSAQLAITLAGLVGGVIAVGLLHGTSITTPSPSGNDLPFAGSGAVAHPR